jgi:hypothetical protein
MNLIEGIDAELERAKELLAQYRGITTGVFGVVLIEYVIDLEYVIDRAEKAIANSDTVEMAKALKELRSLK